MNKFLVGVCTVLEIGSIIGLAAIALKRNRDCYDAQMELAVSEFKGLCKDVEIIHLKHKIGELESKGEEEES